MHFSTVSYSIAQAHPQFRIDADYWRPDFMRNAGLLSSSASRIADVVHTPVANIKSAPLSSGFQYLEINKVHTGDGTYDTAFVEVGEEPDRAHYILQRNDVAVSTVRPNRNAVAFVKDGGIVGSSGFCVLRAAQVPAEYLYIFCKTRYFITCLMRANKATMYPAVAAGDVLDVPILLPTGNLSALTVRAVAKAVGLQDESAKIFGQTRDLLLDELGLVRWQPKHRLSFIKNYSDTESARRIDAEYYQPIHAELLKKIHKYPHGWDALGKLVSVKAKKVNPNSGAQYRYIELSDVSDDAEVLDCASYLGEELPTRARRRVASGEVIVSSVEGSLSSIALIDATHANALCSTGFHVVSSSSINGETLLVLLKSVVGQQQLKKGCSGTILTAIQKEELDRIVLPKVAQAVQETIRLNVKRALAARKQANRLLASATDAVEAAIADKGT